MEERAQPEQSTDLKTPSSEMRAETVSTSRLSANSESQRPKEPSLKIGEQIGGCVITRFIAWGGMGEVYEGRHETLDRRVAIKLIRQSYADDPKYRARFLREAKAAAQFTDSRIALVFDAGEDFGRLYVTHEYIDGEDLAQRLKRLQMLSPTEALRVARDVALALTVAHAKGVIHRDVKPSNIMISSQSGNAKLMDFGLVRMMHGADFDHAEKETVIGTPHYMGPEQWQSSTVDARADIYSLGVTLYEILSGELPVSGQTLSEIYEQTVKYRLIPLRDRHPGLDPEVYALVDSLLAPLDRRIQSAQEAVSRIDSVLHKSASSRAFSSAQIVAPSPYAMSPAGVPRPVSKPPAHSKWAYALLGASVVLIAAVVSFWRVDSPATDSRITLDWMLAGQHKTTGDKWESTNLLENCNLNSGDQFQIQVLPHQKCFVYVVMVTSQDEPILLYPASGDPKAATVKENEPVVLPAAELWYKLDEHPGEEKVYVVASHKPVESLSRILRQAATRGSPTPAPASDWKMALEDLNKMSETLPPQTRGIAGVTTAKPVSIKLADGSSTSFDFANLNADTSIVKKVVLKHH
jgi:serine/threonine protein kinase